jgi:hypothetical protein
MPLSGREEYIRSVRYICRNPGQRACVLYTYEGRGSLVAGVAGFSQIRKGPLGQGAAGWAGRSPGWLCLSLGRRSTLGLSGISAGARGKELVFFIHTRGRGVWLQGMLAFLNKRKGPLGRGPRAGLKDPEPGYASLSGQEDHSAAGDLCSCRLRAAGTCSIYAAMASRVAEKLYFGRCAGFGFWGLCGLRMFACWSVLPERTYEVLLDRVIWIFVCGRILHGGVFFVRRPFLLILRT